MDSRVYIYIYTQTPMAKMYSTVWHTTGDCERLVHVETKCSVLPHYQESYHAISQYSVYTIPGGVAKGLSPQNQQYEMCRHM
jgi:hypothetical protein